MTNACLPITIIALLAALAPAADRPKPLTEADVPYPPTLPNNAALVTDTSPDFLTPPDTLKPGVALAKTPPTIDFAFYPGQTYPGKPWSNWGDGVTSPDGRYYSAIGDHLAIGPAGAGPHGPGNAFVFEYDPAAKSLRPLVNVAKTLNLPAGHYVPGKIHSRLDMGADGRLYFATHRGSEKAAADKNHYAGDWIFAADPKTGKTEVIAQGPVPKHSIPCSVLDPDRLIFYGGTAAGPDADVKGIQFFAYDIKAKKLLYAGPDGPGRYMILARSTGRVYFAPGTAEGQLMRYDPATPGAAPAKVEDATMGIRAATRETPQGLVYAVSSGQGAPDATLWSLNVKTEEVRKLGPAAIGAEAYIASIDADPTGRYLYYTPGAHGSGPRDNTPIVQYDTKTNQKKVLAFLHPFYQAKYGFTPRGTFSTALSPDGATLFVTWNVSRNTRAWDCCALTAIHIPAAERQP